MSIITQKPERPFFVFCVLVLVVFITITFAGCKSAKAGQKTYEFGELRRSNLERTVSSSGAINPVSTVKVLPRMSGKVEKIHVDYNDLIRKGDILAELNTDMLRLQREQQYASVIKARANYELQKVNYETQKALAEKNLISEYELKTSKTTMDSQAADLAAAEANLRVIETEINQYAFITSPIDGIVMARNINIGDTVVDSSSNNSSSIFTLAENLKEMQIEAGVGELDISSIHKGQTVRFTLESLPGRRFTGEVETLRLVPTVQNNVVSYTVIINVENRDGSLLPGMTCAVDFIVDQKENVIVAPNAALRYQPTGLSAEEIADMVFNAGLKGLTEEQRAAAIEARAQRTQAASVQGGAQGQGIQGIMMGGAPAGGMRGMPGGGGPGGRPPNAGGPQSGGQARTGTGERQIVMRNLWYLDGDGKLDVMRVRIGISDTVNTEIITDENIEGTRFILREKL